MAIITHGLNSSYIRQVLNENLLEFTIYVLQQTIEIDSFNAFDSKQMGIPLKMM